jgi:hypothetical protein
MSTGGRLSVFSVFSNAAMEGISKLDSEAELSALRAEAVGSRFGKTGWCVWFLVRI